MKRAPTPVMSVQNRQAVNFSLYMLALWLHYRICKVFFLQVKMSIIFPSLSSPCDNSDTFWLSVLLWSASDSLGFYLKDSALSTGLFKWSNTKQHESWLPCWRTCFCCCLSTAALSVGGVVEKQKLGVKLSLLSQLAEYQNAVSIIHRTGPCRTILSLYSVFAKNLGFSLENKKCWRVSLCELKKDIVKIEYEGFTE